MYEIKNIIPREYQKNIFESCKSKSSLVILPTGIGKTAISVMLSVYRLNEHLNSKVVICSPTKPLCSQHITTFIQHTTIPQEKIILYTGTIKPSERAKLWQDATIIVATPQTIQSDLNSSRIDLKIVSLLTIDEAHRSRMKFANTIIAGKYREQSAFPLLIGLTASPGSSKEKIQEICSNLGIESIEIRTEEDEDVKPYVQERKLSWIEIYLPKEFQDIKVLIYELYYHNIEELRNFGLSKPSKAVNKKDLLILRKQLEYQLKGGSKASYYGLSLVAQAMKLDHAIDLLETQGLIPLTDYWSKLSKENTKAAKSIMKHKSILEAIEKTKLLVESSYNHPKFDKLKQIIEDQLASNSQSKIIIFANYRNTVKSIVQTINKLEKVRAIELMGQREGITQKKQIENIRNFDSGVYNILVGTSIGEEGLHIGEATVAIFYDIVSSEIRTIQRSGRVGRVKSGQIILLMTKGSRDEAFYWTAKRKEKSMRKTVQNIKENNWNQSLLKEKSDESDINRS